MAETKCRMQLQTDPLVETNESSLIISGIGIILTDLNIKIVVNFRANQVLPLQGTHLCFQVRFRHMGLLDHIMS